MMKESFEVTIVDHNWPDLTITVVPSSGPVVQERKQYDLALVGFEVSLQNALRRAVTNLINSHKRS